MPASPATASRAPRATSACPIEQFSEAVFHAPATRPDRYTILEHLDLSEGEVGDRVRAYSDAYDR